MIPSGLDIAFAPMLPLWALAVLAVLSVLVLAAGLWRRARGIWLRAAAVVVLLLALANPAIIAEQRETQSDIALLLTDRSPSQRIGDRPQQTDAALEALRAELARQPNLEVREVTVEPAGANREGTQLLATAQQALSNIPRRRLAGIVALTDGQAHDADTLSETLPAPFHALITGEKDEQDRRLVIRQAPSFGMVGKEVTIRLAVEDDAAAEGTPVSLRLRLNGEREEVIAVPANSEEEIAFTLDRGGQSVLEIEAAPGERELTLINNRAVLSINGVRDRLRVLLVSGEPHAGERTWRNLLKADPSVDLVHFTILRPPEKQDGTPIRELSLISFPIRELFEVKIDEFDLIIFDRYKRRGVLPRLYLGNIAEYVRKGGALLMAVGPDFASPVSLYQTPIGDILPAEPSGDVHEEGYRPTLTALGRRHPVTADLSGAGPEGGVPGWGRWFRLVDTQPRSGTVVMQDERARPLVVLDRVGEGRVAQINSDHMWLWTRGFEGGGPQAELLRRVAHWLMKEPDLEENDLRATVRGDRMEIERRSLEPAAETVEVTGPSGETLSVPLAESGEGRATGTLTVEEPGLYRLSDGERTRLVTVGAVNPVEYADVRATDTVLAPVAEESGGSVHWLADGMPDLRRVDADRRATGRNWIGLRANNDYIVTGVLEVPLLPALLTLLLALGALIGGWLREAR